MFFKIIITLYVHICSLLPQLVLFISVITCISLVAAVLAFKNVFVCVHFSVSSL